MANLRHSFVSGKADGADPTVVRPSDWNDQLQYTDLAGVPSGNYAVVREFLTGPRTYYVRANGVDDNARTGLSNTDAVAFKTVLYAVGRVGTDLDTNGWDVTISVQSGTVTVGGQLNTIYVGGGSLILDFNGGTVAETSGTGAIIINSEGDQYVKIINATITNSAAHGVVAYGNSSVEIGTGINFGACAGTHILGDDHSSIHIFNSYTISGNAAEHYYSFARSYFNSQDAPTVTLTGTPAFSFAFALADNGGALYLPNITFSGSATGTRYVAQKLGLINVNGAGATYFPGNVGGSTATGGQYV